MSSTKPYLLRAIFEWCEDNAFTPQVLVNAFGPEVEVPQDHIVDGQIVLNIGSTAVQLHVMDNDCLSFSARFNGIEHDIYLPMDSIVAIFARENSQGIFFEEMDDDGPDEPSLVDVSASKKASDKDKSKSNKTKQSHLKIIK